MAKIQALVFDFDGLIMDTEGPQIEAWQEVYGHYNQVLPQEKWMLILGSDYTAFDPLLYLRDLVGGRIDLEAVRRLQDDRANEIIAGLGALPGVREYLDQAIELGLRLAVASSSDAAWVTGKLERLGLRHYFEFIVTKEYVERVKPDPALYEVAVQKLGVQPQDALALEDSPNGLRAAKLAGLRTLAVRSDLTRDLALEDADLIVDSLADLPLQEVLSRLNGARPAVSVNGKQRA